jgi:hypothetical protein
MANDFFELCGRSTRLIRRSAVAGVATTGLLAALLVGASPAFAAADTVNGGAYGVEASLLGLQLLGATPSVTLPADGQTTTGTTVDVNAPGLLSTGDVTATTAASGVGTAAETVTSSASVANLNVSLLSLLTAGAVSSSCTSNALGSVGSISVTNLKVLGASIPVGDDIPPNFNVVDPALNGVATITLNKETATNTVGTTSLTVDAIQIRLLGAVNAGTVINVAQSSCGAAGPGINLPPTIATNGVSPSSGPTAGGTMVTITGTGFGPGTSVTIGGHAATNVTPNTNGTSITAVTPAGAVGPADVTVTTPTGTATDAGGFSYLPPPTIALGGVTPTDGPTAGGTPITITGTGFVAPAAVDVDGVPATDVNVVSPTEITAKTPAGTAGAADVSVADADGTATGGTFTYLGAPTISGGGISPAAGPLDGGTPITITGTGFVTPSTVDVGGVPATDVTVDSPTQITAVTPAGGAAGSAPVVVGTPGGTSAPQPFTYVVAPTATSLTPTTGPAAGGTTVTITGSGFAASASTPTVDFGMGAATSVTVTSDTSLTAVSPGGAGTVQVSVTTPGGTATAGPFVYVGAGIEAGGISPAAGPTNGGTSITITGNGFTGVTAVDIGGNPAATFNVDSSTQISATTPAGSPGPAPVVVTTGTGNTNPEPFTYDAVPTITTGGITPARGPAAGGTPVTIGGSGFTPDATVDFGSTPATDVTVDSSTNITATTPAGAAGASAVTVTTPGGTSAPQTFTYDAVPVITPTGGLSPATGPAAGGTPVTVTGSGFTPDATVDFGSTPATDVIVVSPTDLTATSPAGTPGTSVPVTVTTDGGTSSSVPFGYDALPTIASGGITPDAGPTGGSTEVTITGTGFTGATAVDFGATPATDLTVVSDSDLTAISPAGPAGTAQVTVTTPAGTTAGAPFTYDAVPNVTAVSPSTGPVGGGNTITITGTNFAAPASVTVAGTPATDVTVVSPTEITATAPAGTIGSAAVAVTTPGGGPVTGGSYAYGAAPVISPDGLSPTSGPAAGGTLVIITGSGFSSTGTAAVDFGTTPATFTVVSSTRITATSPAGTTGPTTVTVIGDTGASNGEAFTYVGPALDNGGVTPDAGPVAGGTPVTITGSGFTAGATAVDVGGTPATDVVVDQAGTSLTAVTPAHAAGTVDVTVTTPDGTATDTGGFSYDAVPTVGSVSPGTGSTAGGTPITITGSGFAGPATVMIGGTPATDVVVNPNGDSITATTGPGSAGTDAVTVTTPGGTATGGQFVYAAAVTPPTPPTPAAPAVTGISPTSGDPAGGNQVEVVGTGLCGVTSVTFGGTPGTDLSVNSACTIITVDAPAGSGTVAVVVNGPGGAGVSPTSYTYIKPGYWMLASDGGVFSFGGAQFYGSEGGQKLNQPVVTMAETPDHQGYWLFAADGGVFAFGDAKFYGSVPGVLKAGQKLNAPIVAAEATADGKGYRLFAADGGVFDFGDAAFVGSLPGLGITPNKPVVAAVSAPFGQGYLLVAGDGGIFAFGDANFEGSLGGQSASGIVSISETASGNGYWIFSSNGAVHPFGDAANYGSEAGAPLNKPIAFGVATTTSAGYWLFGIDGGVFTFGDAPFLGSLGGLRLNEPILGGIGF